MELIKNKYGLRVKTYKDTMNTLFDKMSSEEPFTYVRFGDGDLLILNNTKCGGEMFHRKTPLLINGLLDSFSMRDENYLMGCIAGDDYYYNKKREPGLVGIVKKHTSDWETYTFENAVALERTAYLEVDRLFEFFKLFQGKKVLMFAGEHLCDDDGKRIREAFNVKEQIQFPSKNAINSFDDKMMEELYMKVQDYDIILPVVGLATRVLAKRFWDKGIGKTVFDIGSIADALAGHTNRIWIRNRFRKLTASNVFNKLDNGEWKK